MKKSHMKSVRLKFSKAQHVRYFKMGVALISALVIVGVSAGMIFFKAPKAAADTATNASIADAYVFSGSKSTNYGSDTILQGNNFTYRSLLRFDTSNIPAGSTIQSVTIQMYATGSTSTGGVQIHPSSGGWDESTVDWDNMPAWNSTILATSGPVTAGTWMNLDLPATAVTPGGNTNLAFDYSVKSVKAVFNSREAGTNVPQLVINYTPPQQSSGISKVLWIMEENTSETGLMSDPDTPYFQQMANTYGLLANLHNASKPSLPNYIAALSGQTYGITDDNLPRAHPLSGQTLFSQLPAGQAMSFAETMPSNCDVTNGPVADDNHAGMYLVRHTGWPYFVDSSETTLCNQYQVNLQNNLQAKINSGLPAFTEVTPAACNDFHKGQLSGLTYGCNMDSTTGPNLDTRANWWIQTWLPQIMAGPDYQSGNLAIFIVWDEGNGSGATNGMDCTTSSLEACHPPLIVISPYTHSVVSNTHYTMYDVTRTTEELLGITTYLGNAAQGTSFAPEFGLTPAQ